MSKARTLADMVATGGELADGNISASEISDITASAAEINILDGLTATTDELNKLDGVTAVTSEINTLAGITATTAELNTLDGFTGDVTDLNRLDVSSLGTSENGKVVTQSDSGFVLVNGVLQANYIYTGGAFFGDFDNVTSTSGALTMSVIGANTGVHVLDENVTSLDFVGLATGRTSTYMLIVYQDAAASGYTIDWTTSSGETIYWKDGTAPTLGSVANYSDVILFHIRCVDAAAPSYTTYGWHLGGGFASVV